MTVYAPDELARVTGGQWQVPPAGNATRVGTDTRVDLTGAVFVAIRGPSHDGHDHLAAAARANAVAAIVEEDVDAPTGMGILRVEGTRRALGAMAAAHRRGLGTTPVIAVTGSAGKTTTKRLIDAVLSRVGAGTAAPASFNNEIGVPLTLLAARPDDAYVIVELGTNAPGEIAALSALAGPDIAVITTIGAAHLEGLGTLEEIAKEKMSVLDGLPAGGRAVLNVDVPALAAVTGENVVGYGSTPSAQVWLTDRVPIAGGQRLIVDNVRSFELGLPGRHNAINALAAIAVGTHFGLTDADISAALRDVRPEAMRLETMDVGGVSILNDAYNANPDSVRAALETFAEIVAAAASSGRKVVVLGDMLELGAAADEMHRALAAQLRSLHEQIALDAVILVGSAVETTAAALAGAPFPVERVDVEDDASVRAIGRRWRGGDQVLLKGSRGVGLERFVDAVRSGQTPAGAASA